MKCVELLSIALSLVSSGTMVSNADIIVFMRMGAISSITSMTSTSFTHSMFVWDFPRVFTLLVHVVTVDEPRVLHF